MALNLVCLLGLLVGRPVPVADGQGVGLVLLTLRDPDGRRVDRHRVMLEASKKAEVDGLVPGDTIYIEGRLARHPGGMGVVIAHRTWVVERSTSTPAAPGGFGGGTHASPLPHLRRGHIRRLHARTDRELVVWVRPASVRGRAAASIDGSLGAAGEWSGGA